MINEDTIVEMARSCIGTPFFHCGRQPGIALDCVGLVVTAYTCLKLEPYDYDSYSQIVPPNFTRTALNQVFIEIADRNIIKADVLLFKIRNIEQHVGIATGTGTMIHAHQGIGRVVEERLSSAWERQLTGVFRYRWPSWLP